MKRSIFAVSAIVFLVAGFMIFSDMMSDSPVKAADDVTVRNQGAAVVVTAPNLVYTVYKPQPRYAAYVARNGDSMWKIADKHGVSIAELIELNPQHRPRVLKYCKAVRARMSPEKRDMRDGSPIIFCNGQLMQGETRIRLLIEETVQIGWEFKVPTRPEKDDSGKYKETCKQSDAVDCQFTWI